MIIYIFFYFVGFFFFFFFFCNLYACRVFDPHLASLCAVYIYVIEESLCSSVLFTVLLYVIFMRNTSRNRLEIHKKKNVTRIDEKCFFIIRTRVVTASRLKFPSLRHQFPLRTSDIDST
ncbi:hypothetical protein PUN28_014731 [Cardiocondyla obscurior]|uniref:Uncharacterized protein n=1 Tax=Cardiocondyla obscurior TaxID=286306 RepID=A0AAW2EXE5_9HYME